MEKKFDKVLSIFEKPLKGLFLSMVVTALNAATFWPLAFDLTDWFGSTFWVTSNYTSFYAMPIYFYIAWFLFAILLGILAFRLLWSIIVIMALHMPNENIAEGTVAKEMKELGESNRKNYASGANLTVIFIVTFTVGLYSQNVRFEQIEFNNRVEKQHNCLKLLQAQMKKVTQIGEQIDKLDNCNL